MQCSQGQVGQVAEWRCHDIQRACRILLATCGLGGRMQQGGGVYGQEVGRGGQLELG